MWRGVTCTAGAQLCNSRLISKWSIVQRCSTFESSNCFSFSLQRTEEEEMMRRESYRAVIELFMNQLWFIQRLQIFSPQASLCIDLCCFCGIDLSGVLLHWGWSGTTACRCWTGWHISSSTPYSESSHFSSTGCSVKNNQGHSTIWV